MKSGKVSCPRVYHKTPEKLSAYWLKRKTLGAFINPYDRDGAYKAQVEVLIVLGVNKWYSFKTIIEKLPLIMTAMKSPTHGNVWDAFVNKQKIPRNGRMPRGSKDLDGRVMQNFMLLQRITGNHPYGLKLQQAHACVDIKYVPFGEEPAIFNGQIKGRVGTYWYRLNTNFGSQEEVQPFNNRKSKHI